MKKHKKSIPASRGPRLRAVTHSGVQARVHPMGELALGCGMFAPSGGGVVPRLAPVKIAVFPVKPNILKAMSLYFIF